MRPRAYFKKVYCPTIGHQALVEADVHSTDSY